MLNTVDFISQNTSYNLSDYYNSDMPSWQKNFLSPELTTKLLNKNTPPKEIFWVIMSQTNLLHSYFSFSLNPVLHALFQLPAARACITLNQYKLLTDTNCYFILESVQPEYLKAGITALSQKSILNEHSLNVVLYHPMPHYAAQLLILMCNRDIPILKALEVFPGFYRCVQLSCINRKEPLPIKLDIEAELAHVYSILYACVQLTSENMILFEQSGVFVHSETNSEHALQIKLDRLILGMRLFQKIGLLKQDEFYHLLKNIQSDCFLKTLELLNDEMLLTSTNYELVKKSSNLEGLFVGTDTLQIHSLLTVNYFTDLVASTEPSHLALVIKYFYGYKNEHNVNLTSFQYEIIKNKLNLSQLNECLERLFSNHLFTQSNINGLINHGVILLSKNGSNDFWKKISNITQDHLDDIFQQCNVDRKSHITERAECVKHIESSIAKINRLMNYQNTFKEQCLNTQDKKQSEVQKIANQFGILSARTTKVPVTEELEIIHAIQKIILRESDATYSSVFNAFHPDKTSMLSESFKKLNIKPCHAKCDETFIFSVRILNSETLFKKIAAPMLEFTKTNMKNSASLSDNAPLAKGFS